MTLSALYDIILFPWLTFGLITFVMLLFITAPYGRFSKNSWGPMISSKNGWIIQESVSPIIFAYFFITGIDTPSIAMWIFFIIWVGHYTNRSFIYPIRQKKAADMPIIIMFSAVFFNIINGFINGYYLGNLSGNRYQEIEYLQQPNFIIGLIIFIIGLIINLKSDTILLRLKKENKGYQIPKSFLYKYISCPNYLGEILEWVGYAFMTFCMPGFIFACWTIFNLLPRALDHHKWYKNKFPDYPKNRKAIIPFML